MRGLYHPPALPADAPLTQMPGDHQCLDQQVGLEIGPNLIVFMDVFGCLSARDIRRARDKLVNALAPGAYLLFGDPRRTEPTPYSRQRCERLLLRGPKNIRRFLAAHPDSAAAKAVLERGPHRRGTCCMFPTGTVYPMRD
jgi:hypothetical protein